MTWKPASWEMLMERLSQVTSASVNPDIRASVIYTLQAKMGELLENAHVLKDGQLVLIQENILELVMACIEADRKETAHQAEEENKKLIERSVGAMAIAEGDDGYENVPIDCPMLGAVSALREQFSECLKLLNHYGELLNIHDGGERRPPKTVNAWMLKRS